MDDLPNEIRSRILSFLSTEERQRVMMLYRPWNKLVAELTLNTKDYAIDAMVRLQQLYPNLRKLRWTVNGSETQVFGINKTNANLYNRITVFEENKYCLSKEILENGGFRDLTELKIDLKWKDPSHLIKQLSKAPKLTKLVLVSVKLSLLDLDELHDKARQLETLHLLELELTNDTQATIESPSSACKLTELVIRQYGVFSEDVYTNYMAKKYKNLERFSVNNIHDGTPGETSNHVMDANQAATLVAGWTRLTSFDVRLPSIAPILKAMGNKIELKQITIDERSAEKQIDDLLACNQKLSLETIVLQGGNDKVNKMSDHELNCIYKKLQGFGKLMRLDVLCDRIHPIHIILQNLMHLKTLRLIAPEFVIPELALVSFIQVDLKTLRLYAGSSTHTDLEVNSYLSKVCPMLSNVTIGNVDCDEEVFNIEFP